MKLEIARFQVFCWIMFLEQTVAFAFHMIVLAATRAVSLMPPDALIDTKHAVYSALQMCPLEQDAHMITYWAMHNSVQDVVFELSHNGFLPMAILWTGSWLLWMWVILSKY